MNIAKTITRVFILGIFILSVSNVFAQNTSPEFYRELDYNSFSFDFNYAVFYKVAKEKNASEVEIFIKIPYNRLVFSEFEDEYRAELNINIQIKNRRKRIKANKTWSEVVRIKSLNESYNHKLYQLARTTVPISAGRHFVYVNIEDKATAHVLEKNSEINVPKFNRSRFALSNIILVQNLVQEDGVVKSFTPTITDEIERDDDTAFYTYMDLMPSHPGEKLTVETELTSMRGVESKNIVSTSYELVGGNEITPLIFSITENKLPSGKYRLKYKITGEDNRSSEMSREFSISTYGTPASETELDFSLNLMSKVFNVVRLNNLSFTDNQIWDMKAAFDRINASNLDEMNFQQKLDLYNSIWESLDPNPETRINEIRRRFLRRVLHANEFFKERREGWRTDRGMIFIIFGAPDDIQRGHDQDYGFPVRIWEYIRDALVFRFDDQHNANDFKLIEQIKR